MQTFERTTLLTWLLAAVWWLVYLPFAGLETRLLWEQTWLTWMRGKQMIGFSFAHHYPVLLLLGLLSEIGTAVWVVVTVVMATWRRHKLRTAGKVQLCLATGTLVVSFLPIDRWVLLFRSAE